MYPLGNELSGSGVSASVEAVQYGKDMIVLKNVINDLYGQSKQHPKLLAPGGFFDKKWFADMLQTSGPGVIDAATHHIYNLGPGESSHPSHCSKLMIREELLSLLEFCGQVMIRILSARFRIHITWIK